MSDTAAVLEPNPAADAPFVKELIKIWRAQDSHGAWEGKSDLSLLEPYILDKEARRALPIMGDPDPETIWRLELFFNAVVNKQLRDVHRFGFDNLGKLAEEGDKYVKAGVEMIEKFRPVADY